MMYLITGYKRSGKDTTANYLTNKLELDQLSLAGRLKSHLRMIFDWSEEHTDGELKEVIDERYGISPRQAMQYYGTEVMQFGFSNAFPKYAKTIGRTFWCRLLWNHWDKYKEHMNGVVVSDVRFPHEVEYFRNKSDCIVIKVVRPGTLSDGHASEAELDNILPDYILYNDSDLDTLYENIDVIISDIKNKGLIKEV